VENPKDLHIDIFQAMNYREFAMSGNELK